MTPEERTAILDIDEDLLAFATPHELALYERALEIEGDLSGMFQFLVKVSPNTKPRRHTILICQYIDALVEGRLYNTGPGPFPVWSGEYEEDDDGVQIKIMVHPETGDPVVYNLLLHAPPRHGKSYVVSEHFPAYMLTKFPDYSGILATYETSFSETFGEKIKDHIEDGSDYFGVHVRGGRNAAKGYFRMEGHKGEFKAAGAGGSITGRGGQWLVVDDPISNAEDAMSETIRNKQGEWWPSTFYNRREKWEDGTPGRVLGMWTRWHEDDLRGRVIDKEAHLWCILNLPAIWEPTDEEPEDALGRTPGQVLCPEVMTKSELNQLRTSSPLWFESQYQGRPFIAEGNQIKKPFQHYTIEQDADGTVVYALHFLDGKTLRLPEGDMYTFGALDLAASKKQTADYTVLGTFMATKTEPRYLLVRNIERSRIETDAHAPFLVKHHTIWKHKHTLVEKQSYGTNLIKIMQRQNRIQIQPVNADKDKVTRALGTIVPLLEMRQLFFPEPGTAAWYPAFEKELLKFPNATHDDQVDVTAYAAQAFINLPRILPTKQYESGMRGRIQRDFERRRKGGRKGGPQTIDGIIV